VAGLPARGAIVIAFPSCDRTRLTFQIWLAYSAIVRRELRPRRKAGADGAACVRSWLDHLQDFREHAQVLPRGDDEDAHARAV
jgi:hypothetical protein